MKTYSTFVILVLAFAARMFARMNHTLNLTSTHFKVVRSETRALKSVRFGETSPIFDNGTPAEKFYSRSVSILIQR